MQSASGEKIQGRPAKKLILAQLFMVRNVVMQGAALANQICAKTHSW